jgi:hypothetical protein
MLKNICLGHALLRAWTSSFDGTTRPSDSPPTFMLHLWFITFPNRAAPFFVAGAGGASRFSSVEFFHACGGL